MGQEASGPMLLCPGLSTVEVLLGAYLLLGLTHGWECQGSEGESSQQLFFSSSCTFSKAISFGSRAN
jgi:hypothetical protein